MRTAVPVRTGPWPYLAALAASALAAGKLVAPLAWVETVDLVFLTAVVGIAVRFGLGPSLAAVLASSLAYNFFFLPPSTPSRSPTRRTSRRSSSRSWRCSSRASPRARSVALLSLGRARATEAPYGYSRKLAGAGTLDDVLWAAAYQVAAMLRVRVELLLPGPKRLDARVGYPPEDTLDASDLAAAHWAFDNDRAAGRGADTLPGAKRLFLPLHTGRGTIGVAGVDADRPGPLLTPEGRRLFDALADQGALAIERVGLVEDLDRARRAEETDRLRQALLTSISHDLRTPLAGILGAATALRDLDGALDAAAKAELAATTVEEAERLNRFIAHLLDMTRLEAGAVAPNLALHGLADLVGTALRRVERPFVGRVPKLRLNALGFEKAAGPAP